MGLFSGIRNLFGGANHNGRPHPFPTADQLFGGESPVFNGQVPIAPGVTVPNAWFKTDRPLFDGRGNALQPAQAALPGIYTFASLWNSATKTYSWRWDEAYRRSWQDARGMRLDCFLQSLLFERKYPSAQMSWHLEPDDKKDPIQVATCNYLKDCIETLPNVTEMLMILLDALWFGRAGGQIVWSQRELLGPDRRTKRMSYVPQAIEPVNGDKLQCEWDGTWQIRLYGGTREQYERETSDQRRRGEEIVGEIEGAIEEDFAWTDVGKVLRLARPYWRDRFIIHQHDIIDPDWHDPDLAGQQRGVGIRNWIYWYDFTRREVATYLLEFLERCGSGWTVYYYDPANPADAAAAQKIAKQQGRNTWIIWPRHPGESKTQPGVERVEPNMAGATAMKEMLQYYDQYVERFMIGQSMSSGQDNESGLGGTGRAQFAKNTKTYIIKHDCLKLAGTLSRDLVLPLLRYNCPDARFGVRWKFDIETDDPEAKLKSGETLAKLGVTLIADELRACGGYAKPGPDDEVIGGPGSPAMQAEAGGKSGAFEGQPAKPGAFEGQKPKPNGKPKLPGKEEEAAHRPVRYQWEQRAVQHGIDPYRLSRLADVIMAEAAVE